MKRIAISALVVIIGLLSAPALAEKDLVESISRDCRGEIARYCGSISPGRSRMLACLYAHSDKLTAVCGLALIDGAPELDRTIANLSLVAKGCGNDLRAYCSKVSPGEGRMLDCLNKNSDRVSGQCKEALKAGGLNEF